VKPGLARESGLVAEAEAEVGSVRESGSVIGLSGVDGPRVHPRCEILQ
jgi:hypothetical protein